MDKREEWIEKLNALTKDERLNALRELMDMEKRGEIVSPKPQKNVNNHIHTIYSFSPYSPTKALYMARLNGLKTAGIMDHDSISGADEFIKAGEISGMAITVGLECRCDMSDTAVAGRRINHPDQDSSIYTAIHGIPHNKIAEVDKYIKPYRDERNVRNRKMSDNINNFLDGSGVLLDFDKDIVPISMSYEGGSITERHILFALAGKIIDKTGKGEALVAFLKDTIKMELSEKMTSLLLDVGNVYYQYDLLGALKSDMVSKFYIEADKECPKIDELLKFVNEIGAVSAYAYLGDIESSVTGDKRAQKFEDEFLDELFDELSNLGFNAITYMPSRNTDKQLERLRNLCAKYNFFEISGEDINSPRQSFICEALKDDKFANLFDATYALIGHENITTKDSSKAMFGEQAKKDYPSIKDRVLEYKKYVGNLNKKFSN